LERETRAGQDGDVGAGRQRAEAPKQLDPVDVREQEILEHEVGRVTLDQLDRGAAVRRLEDHVALGPERGPEHLPGDRVVLDDQDGLGHGHSWPAAAR